jgi:hypothetical protein
MPAESHPFDLTDILLTRVHEGHPVEDIAAQAHAGVPLEAVRGYLALSLAIVTLDGTESTDDTNDETTQFILEQREAARQYARLLLELYRKATA